MLSYQEEEHLQLNFASKSHFLDLVKWTKFISIVVFAYIGLLFLSIISLMFNSAILSAYFNSAMQMGSYLSNLSIISFCIVYLIFLVFFSYINYLLFKFSVNVKKGLLNNDIELFNSGIDKLRVHYKIFGVLLAIALCFGALIIILSVFSALL